MRVKFKLPKPINTSGRDKSDFMEDLDKNYSHLGNGSYAEVYALDKKTVLKIGYTNDDHYLQYLQYVGLESANVNLPFIHDVVIYDPNPKSPYSAPFYTVEMERLLTHAELVKSLVRRGLSRHDSNMRVYDYWLERGVNDQSELNPHCGCTPHDPYLIDVIKILQNFIVSATFDLHSGNVMYRLANRGFKFDAVITDPVV